MMGFGFVVARCGLFLRQMEAAISGAASAPWSLGDRQHSALVELDPSSRPKSPDSCIANETAGLYTSDGSLCMQNRRVNSKIIELLQRTDACTVSNAIETFNIRMRNEGYVQRDARCIFPEFPPVAGYAVTGRIRTNAPPIAGLCYYHRQDWWEYVAGFPSPKIIAMEDMDPEPGIGAFFGEIHARIAKALGCAAYVTNGAVRDVEAVKAAGVQCFAGHIAVSHSYAHVTEFGEPVEIGGLKISPGDLLQGDVHGIQQVPFEIAERLPDAISGIVAHEAELIQMCQSHGFTIEKLGEALRKAREWSPRLEVH
jgi:regulator of RNase E activity RraA